MSTADEYRRRITGQSRGGTRDEASVSEIPQQRPPTHHHYYECGAEVTYVVPDTEPVLTLDGLARLVAERPDFAAPGQFAFYEVDRLDLGNGYVVVTAQTLRFEDAA